MRTGYQAAGPQRRAPALYLIKGQNDIRSERKDRASMKEFLHCTESEAKSYARLKVFRASGTFEVMAASRPIFGRGWESETPRLTGSGKKDHGDDIRRSMRRARRRLRDLALCNEFAWFVTLTFSPEKVDRYDISDIWRRVRAWLSNNVQRRGLAYVLVPEFHKDGAIHFHGFVNDVLEMADSGTISGGNGRKKPARPRSAAERERWLLNGGHICYNVVRWTLGFSCAIRLYGNYAAAVAYVCKYIGKSEDNQKIGGRWYYSGGVLLQPEEQILPCHFVDVAALDGAYCMDIEEAGFSLAIKQGDLNELSVLLDSIKGG